MVKNKSIQDKILQFFQEMEAASISSLAPDHMIRLVDISKQEQEDDEDDTVSDVFINRK